MKAGWRQHLGGWLRERLDPDRLKRVCSAAFVYGEIDSRLQVDEAIQHQLRRPIPGYAVRHLWCMGGISLLLFFNQVLTGTLLLVYYKPGSQSAYESVRYLMEAVPLGWLVRQMHAWGAHLMVLTVVIHMFKVFIAKAYRPPRELNWMVGTLLFVLTFSFAFTGYLLPWDQLAYWATTVGTDSVSALPVIGESLLLYMRGGEVVSDATLARFFVAHTVLLPWFAVGCLVAHFTMIRRQGISRPL